MESATMTDQPTVLNERIHDYDPEKVTINKELVTPERAVEYLAVNERNRKLRDTTVGRYSRDMVSGEWHDFGNIIMFSNQGILLNGQHTLSAIVDSGKAQWLFVARELHPDLILSLDKGAKRNWAEDAEIYDPNNGWINETQNKELAVALGTAGYMLASGGGKDKKGKTFTDAEKIQVLRWNKDAIDWVNEHLPKKKRNIKTRIAFNPNATIRAMVCRAWYHVDHEELAEFCRILVNGFSEDSKYIPYVQGVVWFRDDFVNGNKIRGPRGKIMSYRDTGRQASIALYAYAELTLRNFIEKKKNARRINSSVILNHKKPLYELPGQDKE